MYVSSIRLAARDVNRGEVSRPLSDASPYADGDFVARAAEIGQAHRERQIRAQRRSARGSSPGSSLDIRERRRKTELRRAGRQWPLAEESRRRQPGWWCTWTRSLRRRPGCWAKRSLRSGRARSRLDLARRPKGRTAQAREPARPGCRVRRQEPPDDGDLCRPRRTDNTRCPR